MTKANRKNITGKHTDTAASASTPIIWPSSALLTVPNSDCSALLSIRGARKARKVFQREGVFDTAVVPIEDVADYCGAPEGWGGGGFGTWVGGGGGGKRERSSPEVPGKPRSIGFPVAALKMTIDGPAGRREACMAATATS